MFEATTNNIHVQVLPTYVREESDPKQNYYFFSYNVRITNKSDAQVQLVSRHWIIKDGFGEVEEVRGEGVVGLQPVLKPGDMFEYASFCPLSTPTGSMQGTYHMVGPRGERLEVEIPLFVLSEPSHYH